MRTKLFAATIATLLFINQQQALSQLNKNEITFQRKEVLKEDNIQEGIFSVIVKNNHTTQIEKNGLKFRITITPHKISYGIVINNNGKEEYASLKDKNVKEKIISALAYKKGIFLLTKNGKILYDGIDGSNEIVCSSPVILKNGKFNLQADEEKSSQLYIEGKGINGKKYTVYILMLWNSHFVIIHSPEKNKEDLNKEIKNLYGKNVNKNNRDEFIRKMFEDELKYQEEKEKRNKQKDEDKK
ncbi:MAG: hypothetical protein QXF35_03670 [Candidatus Bilamarchaeaceae archaeon]